MTLVCKHEENAKICDSKNIKNLKVVLTEVNRSKQTEIVKLFIWMKNLKK